MRRNNRTNTRWTMEGIEKARTSTSKNSQLSVEQFKTSVEKKRQETDIQKSFIELTEIIPYRKGVLRDVIYAIPNGGFRSKKTSANLKREGTKRGIPDIHCFVAVFPYHSLYIEMKTETGDLTPEQKDLIPILREEGHKVVICRSEEQALRELCKYLGVKI